MTNAGGCCQDLQPACTLLVMQLARRVACIPRRLLHVGTTLSALKQWADEGAEGLLSEPTTVHSHMGVATL